MLSISNIGFPRPEVGFSHLHPGTGARSHPSVIGYGGAQGNPATAATAEADDA